MSLKLLLMTIGGPSITVTANTGNINNSRSSAVCYTGVQFNSSGAELASNRFGTYTVGRGNWLDAGTSDQVWIERTVGPGTLNSIDPGAGRLQLNTTRTFEIKDDTSGAPFLVITTVKFDFYDASSGGNLLDSVTIQLQASWT